MISWLFLIFGGMCEVGFVAMMKKSKGFRVIKYSLLTVLFMILSFYSLSHALVDIQIGIGYAVWAGIGAVGSVLVGMIFFGESKDVKKILLIAIIIAGIVGLKLSSN